VGSTSKSSVVDFRTLRLRSHDWVRVRIVVPAPIDHDRLLDAEYDGFLPIKAIADNDGKVGDLVGTFWAGLYVMADRFKRVLEQHAIRGWHAYETVCEGLPSQTTWWVLGIAGRAGPVLTGPRAVRAGLDSLGQYLDPREWDGSDVFHRQTRALSSSVLGRPRRFSRLTSRMCSWSPRDLRQSRVASPATVRPP